VRRRANLRFRGVGEPSPAELAEFRRPESERWPRPSPRSTPPRPRWRRSSSGGLVLGRCAWRRTPG